MIMAPDFVDRILYGAAVAKTLGNLGEPPETPRLEPLNEGHCPQTLYIGSYDNEGPALAKLHGKVIPRPAIDLRRSAS